MIKNRLNIEILDIGNYLLFDFCHFYFLFFQTAYFIDRLYIKGDLTLQTYAWCVRIASCQTSSYELTV